METQKKTVREWFEELPEPYKSQAIANTSEESLNMYKKNLLEALKSGFSWLISREGPHYWYKLYKNLEEKFSI